MKIIATFFTAALVGSLPLAADNELRETGVKLSADYGDSVIWLSVIAKTTMSAEGDVPDQVKAQLASQDQESTNETTATFINEDGLMVAALAQLDQASMMDGQTVTTPMGQIKLNSRSEITEIRAIMPDGTEIPADLVLKDTDLGIGFVQLRMDSDEAEGVEITAVDLDRAAEGSLLDPCITLGRLDERMNRERSVLTSEISGMTTRPRTFYRVATDSIGSPVFLASGDLLGFTIVRKPTGTIESGNFKVSPVVLPVADISRIAAQVGEE